MGGRGQGPPRDRATAKAEQGEAPCYIDSSQLTLQLGAKRPRGGGADRGALPREVD